MVWAGRVGISCTIDSASKLHNKFLCSKLPPSRLASHPASRSLLPFVVFVSAAAIDVGTVAPSLSCCLKLSLSLPKFCSLLLYCWAPKCKRWTGKTWELLLGIVLKRAARHSKWINHNLSYTTLDLLIISQTKMNTLGTSMSLSITGTLHQHLRMQLPTLTLEEQRNLILDPICLSNLRTLARITNYFTVFCVLRHSYYVYYRLIQPFTIIWRYFCDWSAEHGSR
jgi:hypothetical protein